MIGIFVQAIGNIGEKISNPAEPVVASVLPITALAKTEGGKTFHQLDAAKIFPKKIVTTLEEAPFYPAEAYHQDFLVRNPTYPYIVINDAPRVRDLAALFPKEYRSEPVLVMPAPATRRGG